MTLKNFVLVCDGMQKKLFEQLQTFSHLETHPIHKLSRADIVALAASKDIHALVVRSATKVDRDLIKTLPKLKLVIRAGEGLDNIDQVACQEKNIRVLNTPGANGNAAAELAIAHFFSLLRHLPLADSSMKAGQWDKASFVGQELTGKTIGIIGFGKIGQTVAKRLQGFEPKIIYFDPTNPPAPPYAQQLNSIDEVFQQSDLISLHLPLMAETKNLINKTHFNQMKPTAYLVNCARGGIIQEDDLRDALVQKKFAGAALDVFAEEPLPANHPLRSCPNLYLTPHLGASTLEAEWRVGEKVLALLQEFTF